MIAQELLNYYGIKLADYRPGRHYAVCPRCSHERQTKAHQQLKCLGITIEPNGFAHFGCNHCGWAGPTKGARATGKSNGADRHDDLQRYIYRDADGVTRFRKVRNAPGRVPRFWLEQLVDSGDDWTWIKGTKGCDTGTLYRADEVAKAITDGRVILVAEGEKDVDQLCALDFVATCNAHGASEADKKPKWTSKHSEQLRGADIVVLNDNDAAGLAHASATCRLSFGIAKRVRRLDLALHWPDMPKGADISDWLALGHTVDDLAALIDVAPDYVPPQAAPDASAEATQEQPTDDADADEITRLAQLTALQYEKERKAAAERLDVRASILDRLVAAERDTLGLDDDGGLQGSRSRSRSRSRGRSRSTAPNCSTRSRRRSAATS
jgi:hypothetical protein